MNPGLEAKRLRLLLSDALGQGGEATPVGSWSLNSAEAEAPDCQACSMCAATCWVPATGSSWGAESREFLFRVMKPLCLGLLFPIGSIITTLAKRKQAFHSFIHACIPSLTTISVCYCMPSTVFPGPFFASRWAKRALISEKLICKSIQNLNCKCYIYYNYN